METFLAVGQCGGGYVPLASGILVARPIADKVTTMFKSSGLKQRTFILS